MSQFNDGVPTELDHAAGVAWCWGAGRSGAVTHSHLLDQVELCYSELAEQDQRWADQLPQLRALQVLAFRIEEVRWAHWDNRAALVGNSPKVPAGQVHAA